MSQYPPAAEPGDVNNNPTPVVSAIPPVTASSSSYFNNPVTTPPTTPAASSIAGGISTTHPGSTGFVLGKREAGSENQVEKSDTDTMDTVGTETTVESGQPSSNDSEKGGDKKRRRIAPTLISTNEPGSDAR